MLYSLLLIIHVIISVSLILVILAQSGKGGALDGLVGGTASNVLGGQGASKFLKNATKILGVAFMLSCILLVFQLDTRKTVKPTGAVDRLREQTEQGIDQQEELPALPLTEDNDTENTDQE
ncbi:MAG: hypothetical protein APR54_11160 [Candidatus Cloacimonas sp. SDB]|nr:MAG: hypothetical protein APR54_11160 [Candidatus Cloacimonas sp. SDB]